MKNIKRLRNAVKNGKNLVWLDSDKIKGNDYKVSKIITDIFDEDIDDDSIISIEYNNGQSFAEVMPFEIKVF